MSPANDINIEWGQLVNFLGNAQDLQDGSITSNDLVWTNSSGAVLAEGPTFATSELPIGTNVITLTAYNSAGLEASTSVTVIVGDDLSDPGPTLAVAPAAVSWSVAPGATAALSATLSINNSGGGTLNWTASSDAEWLTLDTAEGSAPATLALRADPSGFAANSTNNATITLRAVDTGGNTLETITVPVSVYVGNPGYDEPARPSAQRFLYLPMVRR
ncbi:BACON domain-containing protein [Candidatus Gracilibacteria bacterium]|nr:BACON domain-containing protein [Candidatus Gracilibacteria bacterium]